MQIVDCETLRRVTQGSGLVVLAATEGEAEPIRVALQGPDKHHLATKTLYVGEAGGPLEGEQSAPRKAGPKVVLAVSGCDKVNAAHVLTSLLQAMSPPPRLVLQLGIAGALPGVGGAPSAQVGDLVVATRETYSDTGTTTPNGWASAQELGLPMAQVEGVELGGSFPLDQERVQWAMQVIGRVDWQRTRTEGAPPALLAAPCVTSSRITGRDEEAQAVAQRWQALAESMEGAAAAHICALYGVPFLEIRGISNMAGDRDRAAWAVDRAVEVAGLAALAVVEALGAEDEA